MPMVATAIALSLAPSFVAAMIGVFWSCHGLRVEQALKRVKGGFQDEIRAAAINGTLGVKVDDPRVDAANFLLNI